MKTDPLITQKLERARFLQAKLKELVQLKPSSKLANPQSVGGVDCAYLWLSPNESRIIASAMVFDFPGLELAEEAWHAMDVEFPYIPGYLSFRELPCMLGALAKLKTVPDVVFVSGQGVAHPRGLGIASHLGVVTGLATIGIAQNPLFGHFQPPPLEAGSLSPLIHPKDGSLMGFVVRTRAHLKPLFVSPGHRVDAMTAATMTLRCVQKTKLPTPLHQADRRAASLKKLILKEARPSS